MSIEIIDILKPKNGLNFKLVEDVDIAVQGYDSLADAVSHFVTLDGIQQIINAALSGKQDKLTTEQLAACNSGITAELVAQIGTNTTAIAGKADAADLTTATANLQAQIDELITPVTQDAEVQNARVSADGTSYQTLKARLDAESTAVKTDLSKITDAGFYVDSVNKFNGKVRKGRYSTSDGEYVTDNSTMCNVDRISVKPDTTYYFSDNSSAKTVNVFEYAANGTFIKYTTANNVTMSATTAFINFSAGSLSDKIMVSDSSDLTYQPYNPIYTLKSEKELEDARETDDGIVYDSLQERLAASDAVVDTVIDSVESMESDLYTTGTGTKDITESSTELTFQDGCYTNSSGIVEASGYKTWFYEASEDTDIWVDTISAYYFSLATYNGAVTSANFNEMKRKNGSENTLPTSNSKMRLTAGQTLAISTTSGVSSFTVHTTESEKVSRIDETEKHIYVTVSKESNKITLKQRNLTYEFIRDTNLNKNLDTWRIKNYSVDSIPYNDMEIEGVLKQQDTTDFIGGFHGDEQYTEIKIYVDGNEVGESSTFAAKIASRVTIFVKSNVYFCETSNIAFERYKQLDFFGNVLRITNLWKYIGNNDFVVQRYPCGMFSMNTSDIIGYTTNDTPYLQNAVEAPSKQSIDKVEFLGNGFTISVKYTGLKDLTYYRGTASYFGSETPPRMKAYLMAIYEYQSTRTLHTDDYIQSEVEISVY